MKNPEQLKGAIINLAKQQNLQAQEVLQIFLFELNITAQTPSSIRWSLQENDVIMVVNISFL